jgi:murein L,D-transpeptidase YafK
MPCGVLRADLVVVSKKKREMALLRGESVLRTYRIALGREPVGAKRAEGDGRTPEGRYTIDWRNARSKYHLSLHISYPDAADVARAREAGVDAGGDIMIHGLKDGECVSKALGTNGALRCRRRCPTADFGAR